MPVGSRAQVKTAPVSFVTTGDNIIVPAVAGKLISVVAMILSVAVTATSITVKDGAANNLSGAMSLAPGTPFTLPVDPTVDWFNTTADTRSLILNQSGTSQVSGTVWYVQK